MVFFLWQALNHIEQIFFFFFTVILQTCYFHIFWLDVCSLCGFSQLIHEKGDNYCLRVFSSTSLRKKWRLEILWCERWWSASMAKRFSYATPSSIATARSICAYSHPWPPASFLEMKKDAFAYIELPGGEDKAICYADTAGSDTNRHQVQIIALNNQETINRKRIVDLRLARAWDSQMSFEKVSLFFWISRHCPVNDNFSWAAAFSKSHHFSACWY